MLRAGRLPPRLCWVEKFFPALRAAARVLSWRVARSYQVLRVTEVPMLRAGRLSPRFCWVEKIFPALRAAAGVLSWRVARSYQVLRVTEVPMLRAGRLSRSSPQPIGVS